MEQLSIKRENAIKVLLRCKKMYEARASVRRILKLLIKKEREIDIWLHNLDKLNDTQKEDIMRSTSRSTGTQKQDPPKMREGMALMKRLLSMVSSFLEEHRIFRTKDKFVFKGRDLIETLREDIEMLDEYMRKSR